MRLKLASVLETISRIRNHFCRKILSVKDKDKIQNKMNTITYIILKWPKKLGVGMYVIW